MKKTLFTIAAAVAICSSASALTWTDVMLWLPNRFMDMTDIVSIGVGSHFGIPKVGVRATRAIDFNYGDAAYTVLRKDYNRWLGISNEQGHSFSFLYMGGENYRIEKVKGFNLWNYPTDDDTFIRSGKFAFYRYKWWENPIYTEHYDIKKGNRDWWEISAEIGCLGYLRVAIHPVEIADFLLGIFFIDTLKQDDIKLSEQE